MLFNEEMSTEEVELNVKNIIDSYGNDIKTVVLDYDPDANHFQLIPETENSPEGSNG